MHVRPAPAKRSTCITSASVPASSALVGSSASTIGASRSIALAIATRCFSPPLKRRPLSPTTVSYPFGKHRIVSCTAAICACLSTAFRFSSAVQSIIPEDVMDPYAML
mmetsp:Transcript_13814/g.51540  ORF Transcript_13814/g.51540 Transcript_13814/m.51540 type:complete len:108 (-) Transcript_13814:1043-1366(-)